MGVRGKFLSLGSGSGPGDIFGDGSNMFTSNFSAGTLSSVEGGATYQGYGRSGGVYYEDNSVVAFRNDLPPNRSGFGKSITLSDTTDDPSIALDGVTKTAIRTYSFWVYVDVHDDDDNLVLGINLKRQNNGTMFTYITTPDGSSTSNDSFSVVSTDTWHHITVTRRDDNNVYTYQNGTLLGSIAAGTRTRIVLDGPGGGTDLRFMSFADADVSNEIWVTGARMFDRGITAAEVTTLYNENPN
tara:strand:- start:447 stop:1172 length:726 start_codon:yes stop_codon:yes gene_type:complete